MVVYNLIVRKGMVMMLTDELLKDALEGKAKLHYFRQEKADESDWVLHMVIDQGYVPATCLLSGSVAWGVVRKGNDPCIGCAGPRERCKGRPKGGGH